ncbi:MAG TPA: DNA polymerase III subunit delta [Bacteroidia bacterium]
MLFANVAAPQALKTRLIEMASGKRVAHALLFLGTDGGAQLPLAVAFAQYLFCSTPNTHDSCGHCPSCLKISKLAHPDLNLVFPIALSKDVRFSDHLLTEFREAFLAFPYLNLNDWFNNIDAENKQPIIAKDESIEMLRKLSYTSYEGRGKVMLIWMPEKMNADAANKILKILEEPPEDTFFFLVSCASDGLLPTIISRTQLIKVNTPTSNEIATVLATDFNLSQGHAQQVAELSQNNPREAFLLADENIASTENFILFQTFMRCCLRFDAFKISAWVDEFARLGREKQKQFIIYSLHTFRNCLLMKHAPEIVSGTDEEKEFLQKFHPYINTQNQEGLTEEFNKALYHIERNVSAKILFMDVALKTNELLNKK